MSTEESKTTVKEKEAPVETKKVQTQPQTQSQTKSSQQPKRIELSFSNGVSIEVTDCTTGQRINVLPKNNTISLSINRIYKLPIKSGLTFSGYSVIKISESLMPAIQVLGVDTEFVYVLPLVNQKLLSHADVICHVM